MSITEQIVEKVAVLPEEVQRTILDFAEFMRQRCTGPAQQVVAGDEFGNYTDSDEQVALGRAGAILASQTSEPEDFSDWPGYQKGATPTNE